MAVSTKLVASRCWQQLQGLLCLYKPTNVSLGRMVTNLKIIIPRDLAKMINRKPRKIVEYDATLGMLSETTDADYSDHPLVIGPRYDKSDVRLDCASALSYHASGVCLVGLNRGRHLIKDLEDSKPLRVYHLHGQLGVATDNLFKTGKVVERASFYRVFRPNIDKVAAVLQASYQHLMYSNIGVPLQSQAAYDLAIQGLIRPANDDVPVVYGIRCVEFERPFFTIEVTCVNEREEFLLNLVHIFGIKLKTVARCNSIKCIRYGPFTLEHALLPHSWTVENFVSNVHKCNFINEEDIKSGRRGKATLATVDLQQNQCHDDASGENTLNLDPVECKQNQCHDGSSGEKTLNLAPVQLKGKRISQRVRRQLMRSESPSSI